MANVTIDLAAEYRGRPAFTKAGKDVSALDKAVGKLGKQFLGLFAARKVFNFAKSSAQAFAQDQAAIAKLSNAVHNLGLGFAAPGIEDFIQNLQKASGVIDDQLRPAMQGLLTTTGSITKSQELLTQAIDISRGSGVDLATVAQDLANAYVGNVKGLKKYNLGLTAAQLKAASFADIQEKLNKQFSGASAKYLETYAGKAEKLSTAFSNAKENIGKGLLDSLVLLGSNGSNNIDDAADSMDRFSKKIGDAVYGMSILIDKVTGGQGSPAWLNKLLSLVTFGATGVIIDKLAQVGQNARNVATGASTIDDYNMGSQARANAIARAKAEADAKRRAAALLKAQQQATKLAKEQALLKKQSALFDLQQIELVAALQGKLSEEDRKRVELQLALLQGNEAQAAKLTTEIANSIDKTGNLAKYLQTLPDANNPFKNWQSYLDAIEAQVARITGSGTYSGGGAANYAGYTGSYDFYSNPATGASIMDNYTPSSGGVNIVVNNAGSVITQSDLNDSIVLALQNASLSGINTSIARNLADFR